MYEKFFGGIGWKRAHVAAVKGRLASAWFMQISELVALGDFFPLINNQTRENVGIIMRKRAK